MSVPEGLRKCGKMKVLIEALDLTDYTLAITANSKVFVPKYQTVLTDKINELVLNMYINLFTANNVVVKSEMDMAERQCLQMVAKVKRGELDKHKVDECYKCDRIYLAKGNATKLIQRLDIYYKNLWR